MSNCSITFTAKNELTSGVTAGDEITLNVILTAFDMTTNTNKKVNKTVSGIERSSKFYVERMWGLTFVSGGTIDYPSLPSAALLTEHVEMFFRSVDNSETFFITDLDRSNVTIDVQMTGNESGRTRRSPVDVDKFDYSFNVRRVL